MIEEFGKRKMLRESCVQRKYRIRRTQSRSKTQWGGGGGIIIIFLGQYIPGQV